MMTVLVQLVGVLVAVWGVVLLVRLELGERRRRVDGVERHARCMRAIEPKGPTR